MFLTAFVIKTYFATYMWVLEDIRHSVKDKLFLGRKCACFYIFMFIWNLDYGEKVAVVANKTHR